MPQLHLYVSDQVAKRLRDRANARGMTLSKFVSGLVSERMPDEWPDGFFESVIGGWCGGPLERPPQGAAEQRDPL